MNKVKGSFWKSSMVSIWMNSIGSDIFTTLTVNDLLWGYEDPLLARLASSSPEVEPIFGLMYKACTALQLIKSDETQLDVLVIGNLNMCNDILISLTFGSI